MDNQPEHVVSPINLGKAKAGIRRGTLVASPEIASLLKDLQIKGTYENIVSLDTAMDIANELKISTTDAYAFLLKLSEVITKRLHHGKTAVIPNAFSIYPARSHANDKKIIAKVRLLRQLARQIDRCVVADVDTHRTEKFKTQEKKDIINRITEKKDIDTLMYLIFGHPDYDITVNPSQLPTFWTANPGHRRRRE